MLRHVLGVYERVLLNLYAFIAKLFVSFDQFRTMQGIQCAYNFKLTAMVGDSHITVLACNPYLVEHIDALQRDDDGNNGHLYDAGHCNYTVSGNHQNPVISAKQQFLPIGMKLSALKV